MSHRHEELFALAPAYALGALDEDERKTFEAHVSACSMCAAEVAACSHVPVAMAEALRQVDPPWVVRSRLLATVSPARGTPTRRRSQVAATWLAYAAATVLVVGLGSYAATLRARVADLEARLDRLTARLLVADRALAGAQRVAFQARSAVDVLTADDTARIDLAGQAASPSARARAMWSRQRGLVLTSANLPPLPTGRSYQVWVVTAKAKISAGLITPDSSGRTTDVFATPPDIDPPVAVAVTLEPAGGVPQPTGPFYLLGTPRS